MEGNKLFHDRYFLERMLGRGNFSEVWLAKDTKTDIQVALKIYAPATGLDDMGLNVFAREFSLVVNANHRNLLKPIYYDTYESKPSLVLPYCKQGSIMGLVGKFTEQDAWRLLHDVASGLAWLHGMTPSVIHQDIKPDNIMIADNGDFVITDFGVSTHLRSTLRKSTSAAFSSAGTIAYMAPERFSKDNTPIMANDIYSLGATVFEMLTGDTPFGDDGGLLQKKGADIPEPKGEYSSNLKKVIKQCLRTNPWERPTAEQLEKYAEAGMKGMPVLIDGEMTAIQKYKWYIIFAVLLLIATMTTVYLIYKQQMENERQKTVQMRHDSTRKYSIRVAAQNQQTPNDSLAEKEYSTNENVEIKRQDNKKTLQKKHDILNENKKEENSTLNIAEKSEPEPEITLSLDSYFIKFKGKGGEKKTVRVRCSSNKWKIRNVPSWLKCSKNGDDIVIETEKNSSKKENRTAEIEIVCGEKSAKLVILQDRIKVLGII